MELYPVIMQAIAGENYTVYAYCNDGLVRLVDVKHLIERGGVFAPLADKKLFAERLTVLNNTVAWDMTGNRDATACLDIDPITIAETAKVVPDPLERAG